MEHNENFSFTYSAEQQKEVEAIRNKYLPREETKLEQLRRLHAIPTRKATKTALILGVLGALILGSGMSLIMTDIGAILGWTNTLVPGIAIGAAGLVLVSLAYPAYNWVLKKQRARIAPEILRLSEELLQ